MVVFVMQHSHPMVQHYIQLVVMDVYGYGIWPLVNVVINMLMLVHYMVLLSQYHVMVDIMPPGEPSGSLFVVGMDTDGYGMDGWMD
jgi:hypothetical protein